MAQLADAQSAFQKKRHVRIVIDMQQQTSRCPPHLDPRFVPAGIFSRNFTHVITFSRNLAHAA
jgi:hypothetical protein